MAGAGHLGAGAALRSAAHRHHAKALGPQPIGWETTHQHRTLEKTLTLGRFAGNCPVRRTEEGAALTEPASLSSSQILRGRAKVHPTALNPPRENDEMETNRQVRRHDRVEGQVGPLLHRTL